MPHDTGDETLDLSNPPFKTYFLKFFANNGLFLPYKLKLAVLVAAIWVLGFAHAYFTDVMNLYIENLRGTLVTPILVIIMMIVFVHVLKQVDPTLKRLDKIFKESEEDREEFVDDWRKAQTPFWYYLCIVVCIILAVSHSIMDFLPATYRYIQPDPVIAQLVEDGTVNLFTYSYYSLSAVLWGTLIGIGFNRLFYCVRIIHDYGKRFISSKKIGLLRAIRQEELTSLAKFAIKIDIIVAVAATYVAWGIFEGLSGPNGIVEYHSLFYLACCIMMFVFFSTFPLWNLHKQMVKVKNRLIKELDKDLKKASEQLNQRTQKHALSRFHDLLNLRNQVGKISTWGINTGILIRYFLTAILPLVLGALLQKWFQLLFPG